MNLKNYLLAGAAIMSLTLNSCADKNYYDETYIDGAVVTSETVSVKKEHWHWNSRYYRYEATYDVPKIIDANIYNHGEVIASVFIEEKGEGDVPYETLKPLQHSRVFYEDIYDENENFIETLIYTELIGFDYEIGRITFYIENSDREMKPDYLENFKFKVSSIFDAYNVQSK